jgi:hypothetical protein
MQAEASSLADRGQDRAYHQGATVRCLAHEPGRQRQFRPSLGRVYQHRRLRRGVLHAGLRCRPVSLPRCRSRDPGDARTDADRRPPAHRPGKAMERRYQGAVRQYCARCRLFLGRRDGLRSRRGGSHPAEVATGRAVVEHGTGPADADDRNKSLLGPLLRRVRVLVRPDQGRRDLHLPCSWPLLRLWPLARPRHGLLQSDQPGRIPPDRPLGDVLQHRGRRLLHGRGGSCHDRGGRVG